MTVLEVVDESPETLAAWMDAQGWGDGLPVVAPTEARVDAMLAAWGGDADEVVAVLAPRDGEATPRAIAANAVMAGCGPDVLPVLVAAVRALGHEEVNLRGVQATTHPVAPLLVVHGDAVARHGFNPGLGTFGPGNRANATVGRALRFVLLHVGGGRPGEGDASTQGQPSKYTYCIAEHAAASPWGAYHHARGLDAPSAVTVHCGENPHNFHDMESETPEPILAKAASAMATLGVNNAPISQGEWFVVLCPEHAATIAGRGWTRRDVQQFLYDTARLPAGRLRAAFAGRVWPEWMEATHDDALVPMTESVDNISVLVAGGAGKHSCVVPSWGMTRSVTVPVDYPSDAR
ncbi:MAG: hypothetical protein FJW95_09185 [Actinobacteria bacterium]|nr:hypothetical protein [Actinomycetota bacterium]